MSQTDETSYTVRSRLYAYLIMLYAELGVTSYFVTKLHNICITFEVTK